MRREATTVGATAPPLSPSQSEGEGGRRVRVPHALGEREPREATERPPQRRREGVAREPHAEQRNKNTRRMENAPAVGARSPQPSAGAGSRARRPEYTPRQPTNNRGFSRNRSPPRPIGSGGSSYMCVLRTFCGRFAGIAPADKQSRLLPIGKCRNLSPRRAAPCRSGKEGVFRGRFSEVSCVFRAVRGTHTIPSVEWSCVTRAVRGYHTATKRSPRGARLRTECMVPRGVIFVWADVLRAFGVHRASRQTIAAVAATALPREP